MKNIRKKTIPNVMKEVVKDKKFQFYSRGSQIRTRLAIEVYKEREAREYSQQKLAKDIHSTQKVISRIESGDVNVGIEMFDRLSEKLYFTVDNLLRIFDHVSVKFDFFQDGKTAKDIVNERRMKLEDGLDLNTYFSSMRADESFSKAFVSR